ncbi:DEAD/DEAH box helicase [Mucilaginibacter sp. FT3.2]|uniref:DEAD/DEAH box helicase n=1 Tax=Mucilaginibacter sp. FT3.2 TaxID=2723090 RepID=UPI0016102337|nr:DEAD/DEAH box helicase [Mucilaginibacter sp. FT3.2]MBB6232605.1 non-specific serine/threonine protein kinase [Mucilaginibacter sp. FT3.2]
MHLLNKIDNYLYQQSKNQLTKALYILDNIQWDADVTETGNGAYSLAIPSDKGYQVYNVEIDSNSYPDFFISCDCIAFDEYGDCKHCVAAAMLLKDNIEETAEDDEDNIIDTQKKVIVTDEEGYFHFQMDDIDDYLLQKLSGYTNYTVINRLAEKIKPIDLETPHQRFKCNETAKIKTDVSIVFDGKNNFATRCSCNDHTHPLCKHTRASFAYLEYFSNRYYFRQFKDFTVEKNKLLAAYGLNVNDPEAGDFEWNISPWGELSIKNKPAYLIKAGNAKFLQEIKQQILGNADIAYHALRPQLPANVIVDYEIGFLFNFISARHIGFEFEPLYVRNKNGKASVKKMSIHNPENLSSLHALSDDVYTTLVEFSDQKLVDWMTKNGSSHLKTYANPWQYLFDKDTTKLQIHYMELLQNLWPTLCNEPYVYQLTQGPFSNAAVKPVNLSITPVKLVFNAHADARFITVNMQLDIDNGDLLSPDKYTLRSGMIIDINNTLYIPKNQEDLVLMQRFEFGQLKFPLSDKLDVIRNVLLPLQSKYDVVVDNSLNFEFINPEPTAHLLVSEFEDKYLMLKPRFEYGDILIDYDDNLENIQQNKDGITILKRNKAEEKRLYEYLRTLHSKFLTQRNNLYYFLPFAEVMKGNWFLNMIQQVQDAGYPVFGLQDLKTFRYNTNTPTFDIKAGSGIDWFDLEIEIHWGDQQVALKDIRKAILNRQEAVLLDDGTLGLIPEEWLDQYGLLLKIGTEKDGNVRISKLHYSILDELGAKLNNKQIEQEILEKKNRLLNYKGEQTYVAPSANINALLRPYQLAGFQWLQALNDLGWGGCLADDMGLGKTLQAITFLQFLKEQHPGSTHLIVCPTSLIFNWESELDKFCPSLKYHTYYGNLRSFDDSHFEQFDIVLTTYGVVRLDVEHLIKFNWHYIILDESQAIKNPDAQVTKSLQLLNAKNRLILSGTPVQNNTYDLFAQFNFINPGFLGNREFFKREFASPIDKFADKQKAEQLRRMVYPFMLRRTKEQVATDLPDKTETILWCSMNKAQRAMYDEYKNYYRNMLLKKIDEEGMGKSGIYVLEGLLRLRQICDHPALIKGDAGSTDESVKTEELMREIQENSGGHKLLVFSQFTEMLHLIGKGLDTAGLPYCYLDGSTPGAKRKDEVKRFQEDETIKVFLISLKAGGVGLNLTAADYVYLVDPWWNPATEQQAIDRTHRIGQTRKIFAYKMICKDTVEEKILLLQQKKKTLADDLINEDSGFVKKLNKEDIAFLFS